MLEDQVAYLLQRYLGNYVRGLNKEALKISVWKGDVELKNMQLKPEALNALKLPVKVKAGFLGSVKLKVPWSRLGQDPVLVSLDRIFLLAEPATEVEGSTEDAVQEAKKSRIQNKSWLGSLISTIIGNLKLSISNIHIRYEDCESNPGHPFSAGVMLDSLSAVTVDDTGKETFITGGALDRIQKSVELDGLAVYLDSDIIPWHVNKAWGDLLPSEWFQVFKFGTIDAKPVDYSLRKHSYILQPVTGKAKYYKLRLNEVTDSNQPLQKAVVNLDDVTISLSKDGYRDITKLAENFAAFNQRLKYAHYRPLVPVKANPRSWWRYAYRTVSDQMKKASGKMSWEQVLRYTSLRKRYISLYAILLKSDPSQVTISGNKEIEELDRELDIGLILQWRMLAHKFLEQSAESDLNLRKQKGGKSWWSFGWASDSPKEETEEFNFSEEDLNQLNEIIGYKEGDEGQSAISSKADVLHTSLVVHMNHNASKLIGEANESVMELSCEDLSCSIKLYPETKVFDIKLGSYQLSSPKGLLAEYIKESIDQIVKFFESNTAVSQTIAVETAAAVQMKFDEVKRTAQQQMTRALKDQARFSLDLDIAAPKITIPTDFCPDNTHATKLLLDLGNLLIRTQDDRQQGSTEENMYLRFDLVLSDVSAFLFDGDYHWSQFSKNKSARSTNGGFLPIIDECVVILQLQQIRLERPYYPSTRLAVRLPSLGFHFSPARYHRLMKVIKIFEGKDGDSSEFLRPWHQADLEGWLSLLTWKGLGIREAVWQRRYFCLVGTFLYVLESPDSRSYKQCISLRGKQAYQVPPELVADAEHVLVVCSPARSSSNVVEDSNALIFRCESEDSLQTWHSRLQGAIYYASDLASISGLSETSSDHDDTELEHDNQDVLDIAIAERLFVTGVLDELKSDQSLMKVLLNEERHLLEFRAIGGQVELSIRDNDIFIGTILKSLEIEDLVCSTQRSQPCYLARSFVGITDAHSLLSNTTGEVVDSSGLIPSETDDMFYEAPETLTDSGDYPMQSPGGASKYPSSSNSEIKFKYSSLLPPKFSRITGLLPSDAPSTSTKETELTDTLESFVKAQIVIYDLSSTRYNNTDKQLEFTSFSNVDEDYDGYDFSLFGKLSEVRIVYLNRFVQEVVGYFMGLIPTSPKSVIKVTDQVTNSEKWFSASEIEGSPAVKFDLSLRKPIILMPRRTDSLDFLRLDIVHITLKNTFQWIGGSKSEINAVHLETLTVQVEDINLNVGTGTDLGESIIQDVNGLSVIIHRSLRDLLHQFPSTEVIIKIDELKAAVSNKEYQIIAECAVSNFSEVPNVPPPLSQPSSMISNDGTGDNVPEVTNNVDSTTTDVEASILLKISVSMYLVELSLYTGVTRDASLATVQVSGAWLLYKSITAGKGFLSATLQGFSVFDDREGVGQEFRLAIGKPQNVGASPLNAFSYYQNQELGDSRITKGNNFEPVTTMLIVDMKFGPDSTFVSLCLQRPQLLVALDFLLAVVEFFVPTVSSMISYEENNKFHMLEAIIMDQSIYRQPSSEFSLSPQKPLIVDDESFDHFIYDGDGGTLYLKDRQGFNLTAASSEAIIYVGSGKKLQFRNVVIKDGQHLDSCVFLGANSSYSTLTDDHVYLEGLDESSQPRSASGSVHEEPHQNTAVNNSTELIIEIQAVGPELTFYNTSKDIGESLSLSNKLLLAQLDAFCRDKPPTKGVLVINTNAITVKKPIHFNLIWPPLTSLGSEGEEIDNSDLLCKNEEDSCCSIWFPEAPKGYVALGCVATHGRTPPPLSSAFCIPSSSVSPCSLRDCITIGTTDVCSSSVAFWRVDNSVGTFLPVNLTKLSLMGKAYELRCIKYDCLKVSSAALSNLDSRSPSGGNQTSQSNQSSDGNSNRRFEAVASFQLIWWNQGSTSRNKLSIWRPVVPTGMVYFGDIAVKGYEPPNTCIVVHDSRDENIFKTPLDFQLVGQIKRQRGIEGLSFWLPQVPPGFVSLGCVACKGKPKQGEFDSLRCVRSDLVAGDKFLEESVWDTSDTKYATEPFSIWSVGNELGTFIVRGGLKKPPRRFALKLADSSLPSGSDITVIDAVIGTFSTALFDDYGGLMVPLFNVSSSGITFSLHGRTGYLSCTASFSFAARSYNDKYEAWEPLVEPVDGFLRYQYDLNALGTTSQLRLTSTRDLNLNISVSNVNMIIQAYASWNNLTHAHESYKNRDAFSPTSGGNSIIDTLQRKNYYIIPQNKLGQDIFIRATEARDLQNITRMPSGDMKAVKVPVSKNMLDSHLKGKLCKKIRTMVTIIIAEAQFPRVEGSDSQQYTVAVRLSPNQSLPTDALVHQQSARTCGRRAHPLLPSDLELVKWNEIFFFRVDSLDYYSFELIVTDMSKGVPIGLFSTSLNQIARTTKDSSPQNFASQLNWIDLSAENSTDANYKSPRKLRTAVLVQGSEVENNNQPSNYDEHKSGFIQISPSKEGPWTTVRLNYAAPAACWRLGNDVVASEVKVQDGNRYVNIRSLVSVRNNTDFVLDLCLTSKSSYEEMSLLKNSNSSVSIQTESNRVQIDEFYETEKLTPHRDWVGCSGSPGQHFSETGKSHQQVL
ncbi:unnamed protein product [Lupinus luteus]|uniref:PH domain-containing protein n=1 Tax=Lupinus luteus TaxID=3873 RepID=A0AAV1WZY5_LUPLU